MKRKSQQEIGNNKYPDICEVARKKFLLSPEQHEQCSSLLLLHAICLPEPSVQLLQELVYYHAISTAA